MRRISLTSVTSAWRFQSCAAFLISLVATTMGLIYLPIDVAKDVRRKRSALHRPQLLRARNTLRDEQESQCIQSRLDEAQAEMLLREID